jgi:hypothetical protein
MSSTGRDQEDAPILVTGGTVHQGSGTVGLLDSAVEGLRRALAQPRLAAGLVLIAAGVVWAIARDLQFYGLAPAGLVYDVDQPPLLLVAVGIWVLHRSRRR